MSKISFKSIELDSADLYLRDVAEIFHICWTYSPNHEAEITVYMEDRDITYDDFDEFSQYHAGSKLHKLQIDSVEGPFYIQIDKHYANIYFRYWATEKDSGGAELLKKVFEHHPNRAYRIMESICNRVLVLCGIAVALSVFAQVVPNNTLKEAFSIAAFLPAAACFAIALMGRRLFRIYMTNEEHTGIVRYLANKFTSSLISEIVKILIGSTVGAWLINHFLL